MFWRNKWADLGIKKKVLVSSLIIITLSFMILYMCIYLFMPKVYSIYTVKQINNNLKNLEKKLAKEEKIDLNTTLDNFCFNNNLHLVLFDNDEIIYASFKNKNKMEQKKLSLDSNMKKDRDYIKINHDITENKDIINSIYNKRNGLNIEKTIFIKSLENSYNILLHIPKRPDDQIETVVILFFPFAIIAIIIISIIISIVYSRLITKPLIDINNVAKKVADLDFDNIIKVKGKDELGELSESLNLMNKNLKDSFNKLTKEIERERALEKERKTFIATISHELKSPITIINGQLEAMIHNIGKYKDRDKYLKECLNVSENMSELVQELLYLSEREDINYKYNFSEVNFTELIKECCHTLKFFIEDKKMSLQLNLEENVIILAEGELLRKAIINIIKNSIYHSPEREKILIHLKDHKLTVENTGITIPDYEITEIFNAFYRIDKSRNRKTGGSGLGLYIVKTILDKHNALSYSLKSTSNSVIFTINLKTEFLVKDKQS